MIARKLRRRVAASLAAALLAVGCRSVAVLDMPGRGTTDGEPSRARAAEPPPSPAPPLFGDSAVQPASFDGQLSQDQKISTHLDLARALETQGRGDDALDEYRRAIDAYLAVGKLHGRAGDRASIHRRIAGAYDRLGNLKAADEHYAEAQKLNPKDPRVWNDAGYSHYTRGDWASAEPLYRRAVAIDPTNPKYLTNLGLTLAAAGKVDAAFEVLSKADGPTSAHANLAYVLAASGRHDEARKHYLEAKRLRPDLETAQLGLKVLDRTDEETIRASATRELR